MSDRFTLIRIFLRRRNQEVSVSKVLIKEAMMEESDYKNRTVALELHGVTKGICFAYIYL